MPLVKVVPNNIIENRWVFSKNTFCFSSRYFASLMAVQYHTSSLLSGINPTSSLSHLQWSASCCSANTLVLVVMYSHPSTALAVSVSALVMGMVLSQEGSGSLPAGHEEILAYPYVDSFSCEGQAYGYYADVDSGCQVGRREGGEEEG